MNRFFEVVKIFNIITRVVVLNRVEALNIIFSIKHYLNINFTRIGKTPILVSLIIIIVKYLLLLLHNRRKHIQYNM